MSCEIGIKGRVFCDSEWEVRSLAMGSGVDIDGKGFMDTVVDTSSRVIGGAMDQAKGILQAPAYIVQYVTCTVPEYGTWDSSWSGFGQNCSWSGNPLIRSVDVVNRMVLNTANDLTAGALHDVAREVGGSQSDSAKYYFPELDKSPEGMGAFAVRIFAAAAAVRAMKAKSAPAQVALPKAEPVVYGTPTVLDRNFVRDVFNRPMPAMAAPILSTYAALTVVIKTLAKHFEPVSMKYVTFKKGGDLHSVVGATTVDHPTLVPNGSTIIGAGYAKFERLPNGGTRVTLDGKSGNFPTGVRSVEINPVIAFFRELTAGAVDDSGLTYVATHLRQELGTGVEVVIVSPSN